MEDNLLKLYKIIRSSKRVSEVRKMMDLKNGEYIINEFSRKGMLIGNEKNEKQRVVADIKGERIIDVLIDKVDPYIKKEIIEYFDLSLEWTMVKDCILGGRLPTKGFSIWSELDRTSRKMIIRIELNETLSADNLQYLFRKIKQINFLVEEFHRTKNTKGLSTRKSSYKRVEPIDYIDEKMFIYKAYCDLKKKYPKVINKQELNDLILKAKNLLKIETTYNAASLRSTVSEFKKTFIEIGK